MSSETWEDEGIEEGSFDDWLRDCDFGFEFCCDPQTKAMGLCTTECSLYLESLEDCRGNPHE